jgi:hypothetical protein
LDCFETGVYQGMEAGVSVDLSREPFRDRGNHAFPKVEHSGSDLWPVHRGPGGEQTVAVFIFATARPLWIWLGQSPKRERANATKRSMSLSHR